MPKFKFPLAQAAYEQMLAEGREEGEAHQEVELGLLAGMYTPRELHIPSRAAPACIGSSDKIRISRKRAIQEMAQNDPDKFDKYQRNAAAAGVDITGRHYCSGLAAYPGDPDGWAMDDNDIAAKAKEKGILVGKEDGLLKLTVPVEAGMSPKESMLKRKRIHKPVEKKRIPRLLKGNKAGSYQ
jgi:hypothetical protein